MNNWFKTTILFAAILALFMMIGGLIGGREGMLLALLLGGGMNFFAYWFSDKMVLRMYNAQPVDETSSPYLFNMVRELATRAELPMPRVYLIDEAQPNAFATGRNPENAAVAATTGIVSLLSERELRGVMAHELAHVKHRDILTSTIAATLAGETIAGGIRDEGIGQLARIAGAKFGGPLLLYSAGAFDPVAGMTGSCSVGGSSSAFLLLLGLPILALLGTRRRGGGGHS